MKPHQLNPIDHAAQYRIQVEGGIHPAGADWLAGLTVKVNYHAPFTTTLTGRLTDQTELHALLQTLYCRGLPLLKVERLD